MISGRNSVLFNWIAFLGCLSLSAQEPSSADPQPLTGNRAEDELLAYLSAVKSIDDDLDAELEKLADLRELIASEKPAIARRAAESALELRQKQRQYEVAKATQAAVDHGLREKQDQLKQWQEERFYFDGMLNDFIRNYRGVIPLAEVPSMREVFQKAEQEGDEGTNGAVDLLEDLTANLEKLQQIRTVGGTALGSDGVMVEGEFLVAGPVSWFVSQDDTTAGLIRPSASLQPEVVSGTTSADDLRKVIGGNPADLIMDTTMGNAIVMNQVEDDWRSYFAKGGLWIYPILILAIGALIAALSKWVQLIGIREIRPVVVQNVIDFVNRGATGEAKVEAGKIKHPARPILERGIEIADRPLEEIEESLYEKYLEALPGLQRGLALIAIAAATTPLLGLLGTVTGMIKTFDQITIFGTGDARALSGGISEALITTAFGLIVAIPALIMHALLSRKIQGIRSAMEMVSLAFINGLKSKTS